MSVILDDRLRRLLAEANAGAYIPPPDPTGSTRGVTMAREFKMPKGAKLTKAAGGGGFTAKYSWDEWFSGKPALVLIERSSGPENDKGTVEDHAATTKRDYGVPVNAMPPKIHTAARRRYKVVDVFRRDHTGAKLEHNGLILQPRDMTPDERQAEDLLRAEEKAALRANHSSAGVTTAPAEFAA